jgi:hypothetical protein
MLPSSSSDETVQAGGVTSHKSSAPVGDSVGISVVGSILGRPVGGDVGETEGVSVGHSPQIPNSRASKTRSF